MVPVAVCVRSIMAYADMLLAQLLTTALIFVTGLDAGVSGYVDVN